MPLLLLVISRWLLLYIRCIECIVFSALALSREIIITPLPSSMACFGLSSEVRRPVVTGMTTCSVLVVILVSVRRMFRLLAPVERMWITAVKATGGFVSRPNRVPAPATLRAVWSNVPISVRPPVTSRLPVRRSDVSALLLRLPTLILSLNMPNF